MNAHQIIEEGVAILAQRPDMATMTNICNLRIAARLKWEQEEMGGLEHVQFAVRNNTPIVPPGHVCHPTELVKRGYVDGSGWPKDANKPNIKLSKWPDGNHWYAYVDGREVIENGVQKWNTPQQAEAAAKRFANLPNADEHATTPAPQRPEPNP